ncbi:zeta toxin family protein [Phenylobacterium sp. J367]|uniref:zeta toxin family protein n=1 Tax=Phenylobacterium sp. J367 TaxID=2898435 RepID=UPI0021509B48|nr:zeta toxin family protein [Phenylobacterium sp. J367]MCR5879397.1 zeta toxin family protein [Phenylobacterium sp. J367]
MAGRPVLHILAGPNGAGKSTLYSLVLRHALAGEFVNADLLAFQALGHHALTLEEAQLGQRLANERRDALIAEGQSLVTESTFSHSSKLDLLRRAKALGYEVDVYHVNVATVDQALGRVASRTELGGHPVPEDKLRGRYERNPALIREAVLLADVGHVFDNSRIGVRPRLLITFIAGRPGLVAPDLPGWARELYGTDLGPRAVG